MLLGFAREGRAAEGEDSLQRKVTEKYAGKWTAIGELQGFFVRLSSVPIPPGEEIEFLEIGFVKPEELWGESIDYLRAEPRIKKRLADANHEIVAAGFLVVSVKRMSRDHDMGAFLLTQSDGETYLCPLAVDGDATFELWRIHRVPGRDRGEDVLIVEFGKAQRKQVAAFQRSDVPASK